MIKALSDHSLPSSASRYYRGAPVARRTSLPGRQENEALRKQLAKQESLLNSLQDGNKVMQQQIDLLNQELRDAKKQTDHAQAEAKPCRPKPRRSAPGSTRNSPNPRSSRRNSTHRRQSRPAHGQHPGGREGCTGGRPPRPLTAVGKAAEEALARNGYRVRITVKTDQRAVFVTEQKVSTPALWGQPAPATSMSSRFRPSLNLTRQSVKADFERIVQGGRVLAVDAEEIAEIERRLIAEIREVRRHSAE